MSSDNKYLIPETMQWMPLDSCEEVSLIDDASTIDKTASALRSALTVEVLGDREGEISLRGEPVEKIAQEDKTFLNLDRAMFLFAGLGVPTDLAIEKIGRAIAFSQPVEVPVLRVLETSEDVREQAYKTASETLSALPFLKQDLVKEAAVLQDPTAVDAVLSLGFLNPENIRLFLVALPELEACQKRLCELVVASRLGLQAVPTPAVESCIRGLEEVIDGLKILALPKN